MYTFAIWPIIVKVYIIFWPLFINLTMKYANFQNRFNLINEYCIKYCINSVFYFPDIHLCYILGLIAFNPIDWILEQCLLNSVEMYLINIMTGLNPIGQWHRTTSILTDFSILYARSWRSTLNPNWFLTISSHQGADSLQDSAKPDTSEML